MAQATFSHRLVRSTDPSLSDEANERLTHELRLVVGRDAVEVPADRPDHRSDRHATHGGMMAAGLSIRPYWALIGLVIGMVVVIALAVTSSTAWLPAVAFALMIPTTSLVAWTVMRLFSEEEHLDPEVAAILSAEGVGDPDHMFNELLHDFDRPMGESR